MRSGMAIMEEMAELKANVAKLSQSLEGKRVTVDPYLPFTTKCQAVVDRFRQTGSAKTAIDEAWPFGKSHFYRYMGRCPELKTKWQATKESLLSKRAVQRQAPSEEPEQPRQQLRPNDVKPILE